MSDDVKALIERVRGGVEASGWACDALDPRHVLDLLAHIDGEPARRAAVEAERDALRAQMEAAREAAKRIVKTQWRTPDCYITATAILRAMDEANR